MRFTARLGLLLTLAGLGLLVLANRENAQLRAGDSIAAAPQPVLAQKAQPPARVPAPAGPRAAVPDEPPTIFDALLGVLDSTDEGKAIDRDQRDSLRKDLVETGEVWRNMKMEMRQAIGRANRPYAIRPAQRPQP